LCPLTKQITKEVGIVTVEFEMSGFFGSSVCGPSVGRSGANGGFGLKSPGEHFIVLPAFFRSFQGVVGFVDNLQFFL
jgi:hypothetical protein